MTTHHRLSTLGRLLASLRPASLQDPDPTLPPPRIPIAELNGGIRLKDISDPLVPVQAVIAAYPQIQVNDSIQLFWNNRPVDTAVVDSADIDRGSITIDVPSLAIQDGTPPVHYLVTSPNGQNQYKSHPLDIRVKTNVPGGTDPVPSTREVNENLLAVTGVPEAVDDSNADSIVATVPAYENMTEGDQLKLSWGGYFVDHLVETTDVNRPLPLTIPRDIIEQAGAGPVVIEYEVRDVVNNWSLWSIKFTPDVEVGAGLVRAPDVLDLNADGSLDLAELGDDAARVRVRVYPDMAENDVVELSWLGRPPAGEPTVHSQKVTIDVENEGLPIEFLVPNAIAKASAGGTVAVKYTVTSGRGQQHSRRTSFEVIGQVQKLPPPILKEAVGSELDPQSIPATGATVAITAYPGMASGDRVELFLSGRDADGKPASHDDFKDLSGGQVGNDIEFIVPKPFFTPLINGNVEVYYRVNGEESDWLPLQIVGQAGAELPAPSVNGVSGGKLDPDSVPNGTKAVVPQYQGKAAGDKITLNWVGVAPYEDFINVNAGNLNSPINFDIGYTPYIIGNLNSSVAVSYRVDRDGGGSASSLTLPILVERQAGEQFAAPTVLEALNDTLDPINAQNGATVRVKFDGMQATDSLSVAWTGSNQTDTWVSEPKPGSAFGQVDFTVPVSVLAASQGKTIEVQYAVIRNGQTTLSQPLALPVGQLAESELPMPNVPEADDTALDLSTFPIDATVLVEAWKLIAQGQRYWIVVSGTQQNDTPYEFYVANGEIVNSTQLESGLHERLPRQELEKLQDASQFSVTLKVTFDGQIDESAALASSPLVLTLRKSPALVLPPPIIPLAPGDVLEPGEVPATGLPVNVAVYEGMAIGDKINVLFAEQPTPEQTVTTIAQLTFLVPKAQVDAQADSTVEVYYEVLPVAGSSAVPSQRLSLQINAQGPALSIDPTPVSLTGTIYRNANPVTNPPANAFVRRAASGGTPPYAYSSSNPNVIQVDANSGLAVSYGSGSANVRVSDADGATASYPVTVSGVRRIEGLGAFNVWSWCQTEARKRGGELPTIGEWQAMRASYNNNPELGNGYCWTLDSAGFNKRYAIDPDSGATTPLTAFPGGGQTAIGWGIFNR